MVRLVFRYIQQEQVRAVSEARSGVGDEGGGLRPKATRLIMSSLWMGVFVSMEGSWTAGDGARVEQISVGRCA